MTSQNQVQAASNKEEEPEVKMLGPLHHSNLPLLLYQKPLQEGQTLFQCRQRRNSRNRTTF